MSLKQKLKFWKRTAERKGLAEAEIPPELFIDLINNSPGIFQINQGYGKSYIHKARARGFNFYTTTQYPLFDSENIENQFWAFLETQR